MIHYITQNGIGNAWVANELSRVDAAGVPVVLHSMRRPDKLLHESPWAVRLNEQTRLMYPLPAGALFLSLLLAPLLFRGRWATALINALFGRREHLRARLAGVAHFAVACHVARRIRAAPEPVTHIHAQWINSSGTIAMYLGWLMGVSYSFTGHATDLFRDRCALLDKIERADFIVCISEFHRSFYLDHGARPEQCVTVYCGIDTSWFYPPPASSSSDATSAPRKTFRILSSGRLVEKKGLAVLLDACRILLDRGEAFDCVIGGSGPLETSLKSQAARLGLQDRVTITGQALMQEKIVDFMHGGDAYVLPCVWAADGDVDGLPQMLMEAMASGLPAVSTRLVGIPDLIRDGETGLLVPPGDATALADAIARLMNDPVLSRHLADAGRRWVHQRFDLSNCLAPLIERYRERLDMAAGRSGAASLTSAKASSA